MKFRKILILQTQRRGKTNETFTHHCVQHYKQQSVTITTLHLYRFICMYILSRRMTLWLALQEVSQP